VLAQLQQHSLLRRWQRGEGLEEGNVFGGDLSYLDLLINQWFAVWHSFRNISQGMRAIILRRPYGTPDGLLIAPTPR
jgi:hypothetical protein